MKQLQDYSIGLDIGTNSVGYAVIGKDYKVLPYNHRKMWGVYLIEPGKTAVARRGLRTARRRMVRRAERIRLLRELTAKSVLGKDESFFFRLSKSSYLTLAKDEETGRINKFNIFNDDSYTDKDYNRDYPTIYHLRRELVTNKEKADPRLIYLAMHHIIKYRGNFLYDGGVDSCGGDLYELMTEYFKELEERLVACEEEKEVDINLNDEVKIKEVIRILCDKSYYKEAKIKLCKEIYSTKSESAIIEAHAKALLGRKVDIGRLYALDGIVGSDDKKLSFSFGSSDFDEIEGELVSAIGELGECLLRLKDIYSAIMFREVTLGKEYISQAMVERYEIHEKHLRALKNCIKSNKVLYYEMFYKKEQNIVAEEAAKDKKLLTNYWAYINTPKECPNEVFAGYVTKALEKIDDSADKKMILDAIAIGNFMPKQTSVMNSYIPHQFNLKELNAILDNQKIYYDDLAENYDKIISLLTFRRPYFVGVLKTESPYSWNEQIINERVYPWNFKEIVKYEIAQEKFINNLTSYCNFYRDQQVLAKSSISYQTYATLNELNCLKIKGNIISHEIKIEIFEKLCKKNNNVSLKAIVNHLNKTLGAQYCSEDITGFAGDGKLLSTMSTYRAFSRIFGEQFNINEIPMYDKLARDLTIFTDTQSRAELLKGKSYKFEDKIVNELKRLRLSGWGRYSAKALRYTFNQAGKSILDTMYEQERHLNSILFDEGLGFSEKLKIVVDKIDKFSYKEHIAELYCSPTVKKAIWSAIKIVAELERIMGCPPKHIFIETTETDEIKKRTKSRVDKVREAYFEIKKDCEYMAEELKVEKDRAVKFSDNQLSDKLYLWLMQMGRCMYSEEYMPIDKIEEYEIDHIVPRCFIKDDSLDNRVLVKKIENQQKSNTLALSPIIRTKMFKFWNFLLSKNMISKKKYFNLLKEKYDEDDSARFIDRQLVETNQIVRAVRELLIKKYPQESVQGIRAGLTSNMRDKYMEQNKEGFFKNRLLNDLHHAKDAYLAAVLGQFVSEAYPLWGQDAEARDAKRRMFELSQHDDIVKGKFNDLVNKRYGIIIHALESDNMDMFEMDDEGEYKWNNTYFNNILSQMSYNDINVVKQKVFSANKNFYDQQYVKKGANLSPKKFVKSNSGDLVPMNPMLYGGYDKVMKEYFCVVECFIKNEKSKYELIGVPVMDAYKIRAAKMTLNESISKFLSKKTVDFKVKKIIYLNQLVKVYFKDGKKELFTITSHEYKNSATQLLVDKKYEKFVYYVAKYCDIANATSKFKFELKIKQMLEKYPNLCKDFALHYTQKLKDYYPKYSDYVDEIVQNVTHEFDNKSLDQVITYLGFLLKITQARSKQIKPPAGFGKGIKGMLTFKIDPSKIDFIDQSITGLYVKVTKGKDL